MRKALEASDRIVDNALLSLPREGEDAYLERLVRSFDDNRHVRVALIAGGRETARVSRLATPEPVPGWYRRLLEIPVAAAHRHSGAPERPRCLRVTTDARNEIGEAWTQFRDGAAILALVQPVGAGPAASGDGAHRDAACGSWAPGFEAVGGGNYAARVAGARAARNFRAWRTPSTA